MDLPEDINRRVAELFEQHPFDDVIKAMLTTTTLISVRRARPSTDPLSEQDVDAYSEWYGNLLAQQAANFVYGLTIDLRRPQPAPTVEQTTETNVVNMGIMRSLLRKGCTGR